MPRPLPPHVMASTAGEPDAVRDHILEAAHRVITDQGLAAASTRAIAEEAGIAVGTLYNYFDDRLELVVEAIHHRARSLTSPLLHLPARAGQGTVAQNLRRFAHEVGRVLEQLVPLFAAAFSDAELLEGLRRTMPRAWSEAHGPTHPVEAYLIAEQELGRVDADADCHAAASLVLSLCHERVFLHHFLGAGHRQGPIGREVDLIARAVTSTVRADGERRTARSTGRRKEH